MSSRKRKAEEGESSKKKARSKGKKSTKAKKDTKARKRERNSDTSPDPLYEFVQRIGERAFSKGVEVRNEHFQMAYHRQDAKTTERGRLALQLYDNYDDPTEVERLVDLGANGSAYKEVSNFGYTALMMAACHNRTECVRLMLSNMQHEDMNVQSKVKDTALSIAAYAGNVECTELLLKSMNRRGVLLKTENGKTAKQHARDNKHDKCFALFKKYGY